MEPKINLDLQAKDGSLTPSKIATTGTFVFPSLELSATDKAFALPRLTTAERNAISPFVVGSEIYNTDTNQAEVYNGTIWTSGGGGGTPAGANTQIQFNDSGSFGASSQLTYGDAGPYNYLALTHSSVANLQLNADIEVQLGFNNTATSSSWAIIKSGPSLSNLTLGTLQSWPVLIQTDNSAYTWSFDVNGDFHLPDDKKIIFGNGGDSWIKQEGSTFVFNTHAAGQAYISAPNGLLLELDYLSSSKPAIDMRPAPNNDICIVLDTGVSISSAFNDTPDASAIFDLKGTTKGFLPPRMTEAERDAISSPATGLQIYNTDTTQMEVYNGSIWTGMGGSDVFSTYTPTITGAGIVSSVSFHTHVNGSMMEVWGQFTCGTTAAVPATISLPLPIDITHFPPTLGHLGVSTVLETSGGVSGVVVFSGSPSIASIGREGSSLPVNGNTFWNFGEVVAVTMRYPI